MTAFPFRRSLAATLAATVISTLSLAAAGAAQAAGPSARFSISGAVDHPASDDLTALKALPSITQTVSFGSGSGPQTHTYTGASLWSTLSAAGIQTDPAVKNDILGKYVLATASDGYKVAYSMGELSPNFGNRPDLLAYAETIDGTSAPLTKDGMARVTAPGDAKGGRYLSNLVDLNVQGASPTVKGNGGLSTSFTVSGDVTKPMSFDLGALKALAPAKAVVGNTTYTGVSFWDLLNTTVGLATHPLVKNDELSMIVVATGSDGYKAAFSLGELDPAFGNQPDLIAYDANGSGLGNSGFARLVVPGDDKAGRYVSNLVSLEVFHAVAPVPEPGTMALMAMGLLALCWKPRSAR